MDPFCLKLGKRESGEVDRAAARLREDGETMIFAAPSSGLSDFASSRLIKRDLP